MPFKMLINMIPVIVLLIGDSFRTSLATGLCGTFTARCALQVGTPLEQEFNTLVRQSLYYSAVLAQDTATIRVSAALNYGDIDIFVSKNNEPTITTYDHKSRESRDLVVIQDSFKKDDVVNILIYATTRSSILSVVAAAGESVIPLVLGLPSRDEVAVSETRKFSFTPTLGGTYTVSLTPYTRGDPNLLVRRPDGQQTWSSTFNGADFITISPRFDDLHNPYLIEITAPETVSFSLSVNINGAVTIPSKLLGGFPHYDFVAKNEEKYFVLTVPKGTSDVVIILDSVYGDADLFVNPSNEGFYTKLGGGETSLPAVWSSEHSFGSETVFIDSSDPNLIRNGGQYFVTAVGFEAASINIRGYSAQTAVAVIEGQPIRDVISAHSFHYFKFYDNHPDETMIVNVNPVFGDPDIFIGCELWITGNSSGYPSSTWHHFNFSSQRLGEDSIVIPHDSAKRCRKGIYYMSVFGFANSEFVLTMIHEGGVVQLSDGIAVEETVFASTGRLYTFRMGPEAEELTIRLTSFVGDADLYVKLRETASTTNYDFKSGTSSSINDVDVVVLSEAQVCTDCFISVFVYGRTTAQFALTASLEDTVVQLVDSVPFMEEVAYDRVQYYTLTPISAGNVTVVLTIFSGSPVLYVSNSVENPSNRSANVIMDDQAELGNIPVVTVSVLVDPSSRAPKPIFIGVAGHGSNCSYTVRAALRSHDQSTGHNRPPFLKLIQGTPQRDSISYRDGTNYWRYYQIPASVGHQAIDVRAASLIGNIDLYVIRCPYSNFQCSGNTSSSEAPYLPTEGSFLLTTAGNNNDWLTIEREDTTVCSYIVGVLSRSMYAEYQISFTMENSILRLQAGVSVTDAVDKNEYSYFSFAMPRGRQSLRIILTPTIGDPDLFISMINRHPSLTNSTWRSMSYGSDTVTISPVEDVHACTECNYYIAVYGYQASTFSITATLATVMVRLTDGRSISDRVAMHEWNYYSFSNTYRGSRDLKLVVTPSTGDVGVFVSVDGTNPTTERFAYSSGGFGDGQDVLEIKTEDAEYAACLVTDCTMIVGVYGYTAGEFNILLASSMTSILLNYGVPQLGSVRYLKYDYYWFSAAGMKASADGAQLSISQFSGTVIAYIACNMEFPNATKYAIAYRPTTAGTIDLTLSSFSGCTDSSAIHLAVMGQTTATYSISIVRTHDGAASSEASSLMLLPGTTVAGSVKYNHFNYYYVRVGSSSGNMNLIASVTSGDVDLYISSSWENRPVIGPNGQVISFDIKSAEVGAEDVTISHNAIASLCLHKLSCYLIVGVLGAFNDRHDANAVSEYRIIQTIGVSTITLSSDLSQRGHVDGGFSQFYMYTVTDTSLDVILSVTTFYGDPDMYISTWPNTFPSGNNYTWMTAYWGDDTITIQASSLQQNCVASINHNGHCELYIAVTGYTNTSYSILAKTDEGFSHPTPLYDGQAQSGSVDRGDFAYYSFRIALEENELATSITFTLNPTSEGDVDMYVVLRPDGGEPGRNNFDYSTSNGPGQIDEIRITPTMQYYCLRCTAYVAVYGFTRGTFSISATTDNMIGLVNGMSLGGRVDKNSFRYYSIYNEDPMANVAITLSAETGDADLYITTYTPPSGKSKSVFNLPTLRSFTWHSLHTGDDDIMISSETDENFCFNCYYLVGVYASEANASYRLLATTKESPVMNLYKNRPQVAVAHGAVTKHFRITESTSTEDLHISLTPFGSGTVIMYLQAYNASKYKGEMPDPAVSRSYSRKTSSPNLYFDIDHSTYRRGFDDELIFVVSVQTFADISYSIVASSSVSVVTLREGQPQNQIVDKGQTALFKYYMSSLTDLQVSLMAREGDPDLLLSMTRSKPGCEINNGGNVLCSNFTWRSSSTSADEIVISKDSPCATVVGGTVIAPDCSSKSFGVGYMYIGVFGYEFSKFTLLVSPVGGHITLLSGVPQVAVTSPSYVCSFRYTDTGVCDKNRLMARAQTAYFSYRLNPGEAGASYAQSTVIFSILPFCDNDSYSETGVCQAGCPCNALQVYIRSCILSQCTEADTYPSQYTGQHSYSIQTVDSNIGSSIAVHPSQGNLGCDPTSAGEPCVIYAVVMSLMGSSTDIGSAKFSITARSAGDLDLIPCADVKSAPDGNRDVQEQSVEGYRYFEICNNVGGKEITKITVEPCYGSTELYACTSSASNCKSLLPAYNSWSVYSSSEQTCTMNTAKNHGGPLCDPSFNGVASLSLQDSGNYYLLANGTSDFVLHVQQTMNGGHDLSPRLLQQGSADVHHPPKITKRLSKSVKMSFEQTTVLFPNSGVPVWSNLIQYSVYMVESKLIKKIDKGSVLSTQCGLHHAISRHSEYVRRHMVSVPAEKSRALISFSAGGLKPGAKYIAVVQAFCDANCLRDIEKTVQDAGDVCTGVSSCQPQSLVYPPVEFTTSGTAADDESEGSGWSHSVMEIVSITMIILVSLVGISTLGIGVYFVYMRGISSDTVRFAAAPSSGASNPFSEMRHAAAVMTDPIKKAAGNLFGGGSTAHSDQKMNSSGIALTGRGGGYAPPSLRGGSKAAETKSQYSRLMSDDVDEDENANL